MKDYKQQIKDKRWIAKSRSIMARDNFTCQLCGKTHTRLNVHHIKYLNDLDYWNYPDNLLMTVCEVCHAKIHGKPIPSPKVSANKVPIYYSILRDRRLTANDKIIYSFIVFRMQLGLEHFDIGYRQLAKLLHVSESSVMVTKRRLKKLGIINTDWSLINSEDIPNGGYFYLDFKSNLHGELLIFYSYIKNKANYFGGSIDTMKYKLAQEINSTKVAITNLLNRLYSKGLAERLPNGKLLIN